MHKVSVIIPAYNRADKIIRSVESVLAQTYDALELIVVDDASTDDTEDVVRSVRDARIVYHRLPENGGAGAARNAGVRLATSEIVAFQDSDDVWLPEKLEKQMAYWENHRDCSMVYCKFRNHVNGDDSFDVFERIRTGKMEGDLYEDLLLRNTIGAPAILADRDCFLSCGGFNEAYRCLEDWDFVVRFARDYLIGFVDEYLVNVYRETGQGVSAATREHFRVRLKMLYEHKVFLEQNGTLEAALATVFAQAREAGMGDEVKAYFTETFFPFVHGDGEVTHDA